MQFCIFYTINCVIFKINGGLKWKNKEFIVKMTDISGNINSVTIYGTSKGSIINTINDKLNELRDTERFIRIAENNF